MLVVYLDEHLETEQVVVELDQSVEVAIENCDVIEPGDLLVMAHDPPYARLLCWLPAAGASAKALYRVGPRVHM